MAYVSNVVSGTGTALAFNAALPATLTAAGFNALTGWVEFHEYEELPEHGPTNQVVERTPIRSGVTQRIPTGTDNGSITMTFGRTTNDPGQPFLAARRKDRAPFSVRETFPDNTVVFYTATCSQFTRGVANGYLSGSTTINFNSEEVVA